MSACARENIIAVFTRLGGTSYMADWARGNPSEFFRIYARLVPQEVKASIDPNANEVKVTISFVDPPKRNRDKPGH